MNASKCGAYSRQMCLHNKKLVILNSAEIHNYFDTKQTKIVHNNITSGGNISLKGGFINIFTYKFLFLFIVYTSIQV